jgi:peroxiredoxin (alkyl hydroperoxide reductase subunit C)
MNENERRAPMPLIGDKAPDFSAETSMGSIEFPKDYKGKWVVLFSHPADFTPVCTTEFINFAVRHDQFKKLNCELIGLSIDSVYSHIAWARTIENEVEYAGHKNVKIPFPIIADLSMDVSNKFGMVQPKASTTQAVRAVFVIDPEATIRAVVYYPLSNGRDIDEIVRLVTALQRTDAQGVATPANWRPGDDVIVPPPGSAKQAEERVKGAGKGYDCHQWFLSTQKDPGPGPAGKGGGGKKSSRKKKSRKKK